MKKGQSDTRYYDQFQIIYNEYKKRNTVFECEHGSFKVKEIVDVEYLKIELQPLTDLESGFNTYYVILSDAILY